MSAEKYGEGKITKMTDTSAFTLHIQLGTNVF